MIGFLCLLWRVCYLTTLACILMFFVSAGDERHWDAAGWYCAFLLGVATCVAINITLRHISKETQ